MAEHREFISAEIKAMGEYAYEAARERIAIEGPPKRGDSRWTQYRHCTRKIRHHEPPETLPGWAHSYRCNFCEGYHITSKPRTGRNKDQSACTLSSQHLGTENG